MKKEEIYKVLDEIISKNLNYMEYSEFLKGFLYGLLLKKAFDQGKVSKKYNWSKLMEMDMSDTYKYIKGSLEQLLKNDEDLLNEFIGRF